MPHHSQCPSPTFLPLALLQVCIVQKRDSGRLFAMKYVSRSACVGRGALGGVLKEVELLSSLEHPFLVNLWFSFQGNVASIYLPHSRADGMNDKQKQRGEAPRKTSEIIPQNKNHHKGLVMAMWWRLFLTRGIISLSLFNSP